MPRPLRTTLIIFSVLLFFLVGSYLMMLQNGWVWDSHVWKVVKTGGMYFSFVPRGAQILIDGIPYSETTSFLTPGILVQRLPPKSYTITLLKAGFYPWHKILVVNPGKVISAQNIFLWPQHPASTTVSIGVKDFWITREGVVLKDSNNNLRLKNQKNQIIRGTNVELFSPDVSGLVTRENTSRFFIDLQDPSSAINLNSLFASLLEQKYPTVSDRKIDQLFFHPFSPYKLLMATKTALYNADIKKIEIERITTFPERTLLAVGSNSAVALTPHGDLLTFNFILKTLSSSTLASSTLSSSPTSTIKLSVSPDGKYIFLETKKSGFFVYDRGTEIMEHITETSAIAYAVSPEGHRLAVVTEDKKLMLYYLAEYEGDRLIPVGTREVVSFPFLFSTSSRIIWLLHQNAALLLNSDSVIGLDMDFRNPLNLRVLYDHTIKSDLHNKLFLLKENGDLLSVDVGG